MTGDGCLPRGGTFLHDAGPRFKLASNGGRDTDAVPVRLVCGATLHDSQVLLQLKRGDGLLVFASELPRETALAEQHKAETLRGLEVDLTDES